MLTPLKTKGWSGRSLTPRSENPKSANPRIGDASMVKGKGLAFQEASAPPLFRNGGMIAEESAMEGEDLEALAQKVSRLENELFEYQYNMGVLLMEKKKWTSEYELLQQALSEAKGELKREQAAHLIAASDIEKREENLRKALGVEKQCVLDLEKTLREMRAEYAEIKFTADSKLAEANALAVSVEDKSLEVEAKLHQADAKLAEASRKSAEIEIKQKRVEARESELRRDRLSLNSEREVQESSFSKQREDLREWERKLQEGEERLCEGRRILNQQEERVNEFDRSYKQKERDLEVVQKKIEKANMDLKNKEEEISRRYLALNEKEMEVEGIKKGIERKEVELQALEDTLQEREKSEIQKLLDEHTSQLEAKRREFELELDGKRKCFDVELSSKVVSLEKKERELNHMEEKISKREQALEKKLEKFKEKENDLESKSKALKEREKALKAEERKLDTEKKEMLVDKESLLSLTSVLEQRKNEIEAQLSNILQEKEQLKVTEEERLEIVRLKSELKQEIEKCGRQKEVLLQEADAMRKERESFEKEWEFLDEKKVEIENELKTINEQKEKFEKWRLAEQERIRNEALSAESNIQREIEALKLSKDLFAADMEHEKSLLAQKSHSERTEMINDFELRKRQLEIETQKKLEEMEKKLNERERSFVEEKEKEMININYLREVARKGMEDMKVESYGVEKQRKELEDNRKELEEQRLEIQKDIDQLVVLSSKLKEQREQFLEERNRFIAFVEKHQGCERCWEITREFVASDLQSIHDLGREILPLPKLAESYMRSGSRNNQHNEMSPDGGGDTGTPNSGGKMSSWLRRCTSKIFLFSPTKRSEHMGMQYLTDGPSSVDRQRTAEEPTLDLPFAGDAGNMSLRAVNDSLDVQKVLSDSSTGAVEGEEDLPEIDENNTNDPDPEVQASRVTELNGQCKPAKRGRRITKTHTMKEVISEAQAILGQDREEHANGEAEDSSAQLKEASQEDSSYADRGIGRNRRKRGRAQAHLSTASGQIVDDSEDSIAGRAGKRRQKTFQAVQAPGERRYNLRRPRKTDKAEATLTSSDVNGGKGRDGAISSAGATSDNVESMNSLQAEVGAETGGGGRTPAGVGKLVETTILSEEVNGTPDRHGEYNEVTPSHSGGNADEDDEDEDDGEEIRPGEVSIGKKLWTFLTT